MIDYYEGGLGQICYVASDCFICQFYLHVCNSNNYNIVELKLSTTHYNLITSRNGCELDLQ
jgi:hypothetical protein